MEEKISPTLEEKIRKIVRDEVAQIYLKNMQSTYPQEFLQELQSKFPCLKFDWHESPTAQD